MLRARLMDDFPESADVLNALGMSAAASTVGDVPSQVQMLLDIRRYRNTRMGEVLEGLCKEEVEPVGYLHLERLEFTPIGYERGDLVYSLPLTPQETVRLTHREWSRTETEYTKLVATQLETAAEEALSETSELTQSSNTQQQHSTAINTSTTVSGGWGPVHITSSVGYNSNQSETQSRQDTAKRAQQITKKASSRSKEEHKITFRVATTQEFLEESYREIKNPLDRPIRLDYYRLMKKWRVDMYRYDLRLTYDIVIPDPGSYLLRKHVLLRRIKNELAKPNPFILGPSDITDENWESLAKQYGASLDPPPPQDLPPSTVTQDLAYEKSMTVGVYHKGSFQIPLPAGYTIESCEPARLTDNPIYPPYIPTYTPPGSREVWYNEKHGLVDPSLEPDNSQRLAIAKKLEANNFEWRYVVLWGRKRLGKLWDQQEYEAATHGEGDIHLGGFTEPQEGEVVTIAFDVIGKRSTQALREWQTKCCERLADAAAKQYEAKQQRLSEMRDNLQAELDLEDELSLRKLEREEIMKGVLRWLRGPEFRFYWQDEPYSLPELPLDVLGTDLSSAGLEDTAHLFYDLSSAGLEDTAQPFYDHATQAVLDKKDDDKNLSYHIAYLLFGDSIRLLHQAVEWENMSYVLYPYFWTDPARKITDPDGRPLPLEPDKQRWDFKQSLYHRDFVHRTFLRAGAARVVLPIRPGFEAEFLSFMKGEDFAADFDLLLMPSVNAISDIQGAGKELIIVAKVQTQTPTGYELYFRIFDVAGKMVVGTSENQLPAGKATKIAQLKSLLSDLPARSWGAVLTPENRDCATVRVITAVRWIVYPHLYMSIADEQEAMAKTNYPYTADANLDKQDYVFTWDNVPGSEDGWLKRQLRQNFYIPWAEDDGTTISKSDYDNTIQVAIYEEVEGQPGMKMKIRKDSVSLELKEDESKVDEGVVVLKVTEGKSYDLSARRESGEWKVYRLQNLVDTWYEFTPTGALDITEGKVI